MKPIAKLFAATLTAALLVFAPAHAQGCVRTTDACSTPQC